MENVYYKIQIYSVEKIKNLKIADILSIFFSKFLTIILIFKYSVKIQMARLPKIPSKVTTTTILPPNPSTPLQRSP
jgi:hypothetical protein